MISAFFPAALLMIIYTTPEEKRPTSTALSIFIALTIFALPLSFSFIHQVYGETNGIPATAPVTSPVIITPTTTPSATPMPVTPPIISVTPSPTQTPTTTPKPTNTPTPRPQNNKPPVISTRELPAAKVGKRYSFMVMAIDRDDKISITVTGLPKGLSTQSCTTWNGFGRLHIASCFIRGIPQAKGVSMITITAKDSHGHIVNKQLPLVVNK